MSEFSLPWTTDNSSPTGDQQASYTQAQLAILHKIVAACSNFEGVAPGFLNELTVAANGANTVSVATGGAMVDGIAFLNDASQNVNIPSASGGGNTRIDRIVLRADWAGFNVSVHRIAGTDAASPTPPAITQTSGTTYDIMLAQVLVTTAGAVTVTEERVWAAPHVDGSTLEIAPTAGSLRVRAGGIATGNIANEAVTSAKLGANAVTAGKIATGGVSATAQLANDIVDDTKAGDRVPQFYRRQGGSATDWTTPGTTSRTPGAVRMQAGALAGGSLTSITFPVAFSQPPLVYINKVVAGGSDLDSVDKTISASGVLFSAPVNATIHWFAIGPE